MYRLSGDLVGNKKVVMQTFETTDVLDARRCRYAQYAGAPKVLTLCGSTIRGVVRSVWENPASTPTNWIIKIEVS
jgi:hypothetical protein